jgi:cytoskeletal protein CcmA (bactofilin family)
VVHTKGMVVMGDRTLIIATIEAETPVCKGRIQGDVVVSQKRSICLLQEPLRERRVLSV